MDLLDHGYCRLVETWGSDERIVESARMSTAKGFLGWGPSDCDRCVNDLGVVLGHTTREDGVIVTCPKCKGEKAVPGDEKLLKYLSDHKHATPFEFAGAVFEIQAPIFVFREWHRHRTQSFNEMSARYAPLPDLNYIPTVERLLVNSKTNKQAGVAVGAEVLTEEKAQQFRGQWEQMYEAQQSLYEDALLAGVPKELARIHLPVGRYSRMRAQANLRNWLAFLTLRCAPTAQYEIRVYADAVRAVLAEHFPRTMELFNVS